MAYGVDQCRVCGKRMKITSPDSVARYQENLHKKPLMTPKQFRAAGWKASPTHFQKWRDLDGVCFDCKPVVAFRRKNIRIDVKLFWIGLLFIAFFGSIFYFAVQTM